MTDVLLISMPFTNLRMPSIALGLLKASLSRAGIASKVMNFHLRFAELVGQEAYGAIDGKSYSEHLVGEWILSESLFQHEKKNNLESFVNDVLRAHRPDLPDVPIYDQCLLDQLLEAIAITRTKVGDFLNACLEDILAHEPKIIGFTSVFEQHLASLSLANLIKAKRPDSFIVLGGPNCEGSMGAETLRQFKFVDAVVSGEGDDVFPEMVQSILSFHSLPNLQGVFSRQRRYLQLSDQAPQNAPIIHDLDTLPIPDYDDYFEQLAESSLELFEPPILLFESSRGCWWGEKQHCTFCGLNGATMAYRSKSAKRALDEIIHLTDRYPNCNVNAVDNILEMKYFKSFIRALAERKHDFGLFYEVKSNLKKGQLQLLREAGVTQIQPGIESLSDNVLKIMRKGVTALQNIQLLKWCTELGLNACYNIIWGFPGESADDYERMTRLIPLITHLRPPIGAGIIRIDRFSPNFNQNSELGFGPVAPFPAYQHVYPFEPQVLFNLAYFFIPKYEDDTVSTGDIKALSDRIKNWKDCYARSDLFFTDKESKLLIWDLRPGAKEPLFVLDDYARFIYLACDEARTPKQILRSWSENSSEPTDEDSIRKVLDSLVSQQLMICQGEQYLSLAYRKSVATQTNEA